MQIAPQPLWIPYNLNGSIGLLAIDFGPMRIDLELHRIEGTTFAVWRNTTTGDAVLVEPLLPIN